MLRRWWPLLLVPVVILVLLVSRIPLSVTDDGAYVRSLIRDTPLVASRVEEGRGQWIYTGPGSAKALRDELAKSIGSRRGWRSTGAGWVYGDEPRPLWKRLPGIRWLFPDTQRVGRVLVVSGKASNSGRAPRPKTEYRTILVSEYLPSARGLPNSDFLKGWAISD